jgi:aminocarboxymuconate-semialdehyde decarboxylase
VIDVHTHYLPRTLVDALARRTEMPKVTYEGGETLIHYGVGNVHPEYPNMGNIELRLEEMDRDGIDLAVLGVNVPGLDAFSPEDGPVIARDINDELRDLVAAHPDRLAAMAILPGSAPESAAAEFERAVGLGAVGAMIYSNVAGLALDEPRFEVIFETAARLDVPIYIHPNYPLSAATMNAYALIPTLGFLVDTTTAVLKLALGGLYERHPDLKMVLSHTGSLLPQLVGRIDYEAERDPNGTGVLTVAPSEALRMLYTDCVCVWEPALRSALDYFGPERILFGSDYPFWEARHTIEMLEKSELPADTLAAIRRGNAERIFGLGASDQSVGTSAGKPAPRAGEPR